MKEMILWGVCVVLTVMLCFASQGQANGLSSDEHVVFFPSELYRDVASDRYHLSVHGWVFEPETLGVDLPVFQKDMSLEAAEDDTILKRRSGWFLVDNERGKELSIRFGSQSYPMTKTEKNGHFHTLISFSPDYQPPQDLTLQTVLPKKDTRAFLGQVINVPPAGLGVISDIDDTIKISHVLNKKELLKKTFQLEFQAVPGMAERYAAWLSLSDQVRFYYVSSSPWQLYPELSSFMDDVGFPKGLFYLKHFRMKDRQFLNLFSDPIAYKVDTIKDIMQRYPKKTFVLVGDSGERDPEVYGEIVKTFPDRILAVYIRDVSKGDKTDTALTQRMSKLFRDNVYWAAFKNAEMIEDKKIKGYLKQ